MILEEATKEAFGYYASELKPQSHKRILAACELCGAFRITSKNVYRSLCKSCALKGKTRTEEHKAKISTANNGKTRTAETKALMSIAQKGKIVTEETKAKISTALKGEKCYNWQGGISFEPYCVKFNEAFKEYIRAKFGYTCFLCPQRKRRTVKSLVCTM